MFKFDRKLNEKSRRKTKRENVTFVRLKHLVERHSASKRSYDTQYNDTQHKGIFAALGVNDTQHERQCHYAECHM